MAVSGVKIKNDKAAHIKNCFNYNNQHKKSDVFLYTFTDQTCKEVDLKEEVCLHVDSDDDDDQQQTDVVQMKCDKFKAKWNKFIDERFTDDASVAKNDGKLLACFMMTIIRGKGKADTIREIPACVLFVSDSAKIKDKMLFASTFKAFTKDLGEKAEVQCHAEAHALNELDYDSILDQVMKGKQ